MTAPSIQSPPTDSKFGGRGMRWTIVVGVATVLLAAGCAKKTVISEPDATGGKAPAASTSETSGAQSSNPEPSSAPSVLTTTVTESPTTLAPTTTTAAAPAEIGSTITLAGSDSQLAVTLVGFTNPLPAGQFSTPDPGNHFVGVQLRVVNTGTKVWNDSPSNGAKLVDAEKQEYQSNFAVGSVPELGSPTVAPGDTRLGWITFAIPDSAQIDRFTLSLDSGFADDVGEWLLGSGAPDDPAPAVLIPSAGTGDGITLTGSDDLTMQVTLKAVVDNATPKDQFSKPKDGDRFLAIQLEFANTGAVTYSDSPTNGIDLIDSSGQTWSSTFSTTTAGPAFAGSVQIAPNDSRVGWVVFELPTDQPVGKIQIALNSGFADNVGEWELTTS